MTPDHCNALPLEIIPYGWYLFRVGYSRTKRHWSANIHAEDHNRSDTQIAGYGVSPRAAFIDAVSKLPALEDRRNAKN